jgi:hypothetical protein
MVDVEEPLITEPPQSCLSVTLESLLMGCCFVECVLISLPIVGDNVRLKSAVYWDVFTAVTITNIFWDTTPF